jgi:hypothetical protein
MGEIMPLIKDVRTVAVAALTAAVIAVAPAAAGAIVDFARNADKVDGKHAVSATAPKRARAGKLVATSPSTGRLPNGIIAKAPNADRLDGKDSSQFTTKTWLRTPGTINHPANPVHWTRLEGVPQEIADGADAIGPRAHAHVSNAGIELFSSGVAGVTMPNDTEGVYCFELDFAPELVLVTPDLRFSSNVRSAGAQAYAAVNADVIADQGCAVTSKAVVAFRNATTTDKPRASFFVAFS